MSSPEIAADAALPEWKKLEKELESLQGMSGKAAYRRTQICMALYEDQDWREQHEAILNEDAANWLDDHVQDLCLTFAQLRDLFEWFPEEEQWAKGKLRTMYDTMMAAKRKPSDHFPPAAPPSNGAAVAASQRTFGPTAEQLPPAEAEAEGYISVLKGQLRDRDRRIRELEAQCAKYKEERDSYKRQFLRLQKKLSKLTSDLELVPV